MTEQNFSHLEQKCGKESFDRLTNLQNAKLLAFVNKYVQICNPDSVHVCNDSDADKDYIIKATFDNKEEKPLNLKGHTIHFDGPKDQARDKAGVSATRV